MKTDSKLKVRTRWLTLGLIITALLFAGACSPQTVEKEVSTTTTTNTTTAKQKTTTVSNNDGDQNKTVTIQGSIRVIVDELLYNYSVDDRTPLVAYVHEFQSRPYIIHFNEDQVGWLKKGQAYDITFEEVTLTPEVSLLYQSHPEFFNALTNAQKISLFGLQMKSCTVFEGEMGMGRDHAIRFVD